MGRPGISHLVEDWEPQDSLPTFHTDNDWSLHMIIDGNNSTVTGEYPTSIFDTKPWWPFMLMTEPSDKGKEEKVVVDFRRDLNFLDSNKRTLKCSESNREFSLVSSRFTKTTETRDLVWGGNRDRRVVSSVSPPPKTKGSDVAAGAWHVSKTEEPHPPTNGVRPDSGSEEWGVVRGRQVSGDPLNYGPLRSTKSDTKRLRGGKVRDQEGRGTVHRVVPTGCHLDTKHRGTSSFLPHVLSFFLSFGTRGDGRISGRVEGPTTDLWCRPESPGLLDRRFSKVDFMVEHWSFDLFKLCLQWLSLIYPLGHLIQ